jgi:hypothetical protein
MTAIRISGPDGSTAVVMAAAQPVRTGMEGSSPRLARACLSACHLQRPAGRSDMSRKHHYPPMRADERQDPRVGYGPLPFLRPFPSASSLSSAQVRQGETVAATEAGVGHRPDRWSSIATSGRAGVRWNPARARWSRGRLAATKASWDRPARRLSAVRDCRPAPRGTWPPAPGEAVTGGSLASCGTCCARRCVRTAPPRSSERKGTSRIPP